MAPNGNLFLVYRRDGSVAGQPYNLVAQKFTPTGAGGVYVASGQAFRLNTGATSNRIQMNPRVMAVR